MTYNPSIHNRHSIRLQSYDYRTAGAYFVTVCTFQKEPILAEITDGEVRLTSLGEVVLVFWDEIPQHFPHIELDHFVVMPNHVHGIITFNASTASVGAQHAASDVKTADSERAQHAAPLRKVLPASLGAVVRSFKSACTKRINELRATPGLQVWQRNYHERIIRNDAELHALRDYVRHNPARWEEDSEHPARNK
jgi:REP element-mobilizing transposase RayT